MSPVQGEREGRRWMDAIDQGAGEVTGFTGVYCVWVRRNRSGWTITDGRSRIDAEDHGDALDWLERWVRLGFFPIPRQAARPAELEPEEAPVSDPKPMQATRNTRRCRRVQKAQNRPMVLYDRPRTRRSA